MTSSTDVSDAVFCIFNRRLLIVSHLDVLSQEPLLLSISPSLVLGKCLKTESIYVNIKVLDSPYKQSLIDILKLQIHSTVNGRQPSQ